MASLSFNENIDYTGRKPNFNRDQFKTFAEMVGYSENYLPDTFIATCVEDNSIYFFSKTAVKDPILGKWRKVGSSNLQKEIKAAFKVGGISKDTIYDAGTSLESIVAELLGGIAPTTNSLYYGVSNERNISSLDDFTAASIYNEVKVSFNSNNQFLIIAVPNDASNITIYDTNNMNNTSCFQTYTLDDHIVYVSETKITCDNFEYKIVFN